MCTENQHHLKSYVPFPKLVYILFTIIAIDTDFLLIVDF